MVKGQRRQQKIVNEPSGSRKNLFRVTPLAMLAGLPAKIVRVAVKLAWPVHQKMQYFQ